MDVTVYWSGEGSHAGALDHYTSPYEEGWSAWRIEFAEPRRGTWGVRLVRPDAAGKAAAGAPASDHRSVASRESQETAVVYLEGLTSRQLSFPAYLEWLEENVDAIQVNGYPWWQSKGLGD